MFQLFGEGAPGVGPGFDCGSDSGRLGGALVEPSQVDQAGWARADGHPFLAGPRAHAADRASVGGEPDTVGWCCSGSEQVYPYLVAVGIVVGAGDDLEFAVVRPDAHPVASPEPGVAADWCGWRLGVALRPGLGFERFEGYDDGAVAAGPRSAGGDPFGDHCTGVVQGSGEQGGGFDAVFGVDMAVGVGLPDAGTPCGCELGVVDGRTQAE